MVTWDPVSTKHVHSIPSMVIRVSDSGPTNFSVRVGLSSSGPITRPAVWLLSCLNADVDVPGCSVVGCVTVVVHVVSLAADRMSDLSLVHARSFLWAACHP